MQSGFTFGQTTQPTNVFGQATKPTNVLGNWHAMTVCNYCSTTYNVDGLWFHECRDTKIICTACRTSISVKDAFRHIAKYHIDKGLSLEASTIKRVANLEFLSKDSYSKYSSHDEKITPGMKKCRYCNISFHIDILWYHEELCNNKHITCFACKKSISVKGALQHISDYHSEVGSKEDDVKTEEEDVQASSSKGIDILIKNFKDLLLSEEGYDVILKVENQELRAHRSILIARSPVFASMFRHNMAEKTSGIVNINDCSPGAFKNLLLYLYCGTVEHLSFDIVFDLYEAAVKYDLEDLKEQCMGFIEEHMSPHMFCEVITISMKYSDSELLKYATDFFVKHAVDILPTVKWELFLKENPVQANELYMKAIKKKCMHE